MRYITKVWIAPKPFFKPAFRAKWAHNNNALTSALMQCYITTECHCRQWQQAGECPQWQLVDINTHSTCAAYPSHMHNRWVWQHSCASMYQPPDPWLANVIGPGKAWLECWNVRCFDCELNQMSHILKGDYCSTGNNIRSIHRLDEPGGSVFRAQNWWPRGPGFESWSMATIYFVIVIDDVNIFPKFTKS